MANTFNMNSLFSNQQPLVQTLAQQQQQQIPQVLQTLPFFFPSFTAVGSQTQPQPTQQPASPTASASSLQILISTIRPAQDGDVITADDYNALRNALVAIANRLGVGPVSDEITVTVAPRFLPSTAGTHEWAIDYGVANKPNQTSGSVKGWMEVEFPEGARIKKMVGFATATFTSTGSLMLRLIRQQIINADNKSVLAELAIPTANDISKGVEADVTLPGTGAGVTAIEEFRIVKNREFKYLLTAEINDLALVTAAKVAAVQIVCGQ